MLVQSKSIIHCDYPLVFVFTLLLFLYYLCFSQFIQSYYRVGYLDQSKWRLKNDLSKWPMGWEEWRPRSLEHYHDTGAHTFPIHSKQKRETEEKKEKDEWRRNRRSRSRLKTGRRPSEGDIEGESEEEGV